MKSCLYTCVKFWQTKYTITIVYIIVSTKEEAGSPETAIFMAEAISSTECSAGAE